MGGRSKYLIRGIGLQNSIEPNVDTRQTIDMFRKPGALSLSLSLSLFLHKEGSLATRAVFAYIAEPFPECRQLGAFVLVKGVYIEYTHTLLLTLPPVQLCGPSVPSQCACVLSVYTVSYSC